MHCPGQTPVCYDGSFDLCHPSPRRAIVVVEIGVGRPHVGLATCVNAVEPVAVVLAIFVAPLRAVEVQNIPCPDGKHMAVDAPDVKELPTGRGLNYVPLFTIEVHHGSTSPDCVHVV